MNTHLQRQAGEAYGSFSLNKAFVHLIKDCSFKLVPHTLSFLNPKLSIRVFLNAILIFHVRWNKLNIKKRKETHRAKLCTFHELKVSGVRLMGLKYKYSQQSRKTWFCIRFVYTEYWTRIGLKSSMMSQIMLVSPAPF